VSTYPKDIKFISIETVDYREQAELPAPPKMGEIKAFDPYRDFLFSLSEEKKTEPITPRDIESFFKMQGHIQALKSAKEKKPILKIEFSSKENLYEFVNKKSYTLVFMPYFCNRPQEIVNLGWPNVYWNGLNISAFPLKYDVQQKNDEPFIYYAFLNVVYDFTGQTSYKRFDLRSNPEDVCFQIKGGGVGQGFKSNVVDISKNEIVKALEKLPPTLK
jgi:hypothetical protein